MRLSGFLSCFAAALATLMAAAPPCRADTDDAVLQAEAQRVAVMAKAKDAVLAIFASSGMGGGSGVVISDDGFALTNFHVAKPCGNAMKCGMADGKTYDAVIVGVDPTGDIALIKLLGREHFPFAPLGNSDELAMGDTCFAMGNPFLLATDYQPTVTFGIVSGTHRYQPPSGTLLEYADCIQTDASINPGNSGGPLFDAAGNLVGINGRGSFEKRGRVNVGVAYAVSINQIKNFLGDLHSGRIVDHATLGATVAFDDQGRVIIGDILEESDAYRRGLRYGDELVSFAGRPISTPNQFKNMLGIFPKGWRVPLSYRRDGERFDVLVRLRGVHGTEELIEKAMGGPRQMPIHPPVPPKPGDKKEPGPDGKPKPVEKPRVEDKQTAVGMVAADAPKADEPADTPKADEQPKAGDKSKDDQKPKDGKKPKDDKKPIPINPLNMLHAQPPMPEAVKKVFEEKRGYANFYFNKQNRERVWQAWHKNCDLSGVGGAWTLAGDREGGGSYRFQLSDSGVTLKLPSNESSWTPGDRLGDSLDPPGSGGLMLALYLWRRLAIEGPGKYGDVYYRGTAPLPGRPGLFDVLVATHKEIETNFYFDPADGTLAAMEMFPGDDVDPCELYFSGYRQVDGRSLPAKLEVRTGDVVFAVFRLNELKFEKPASK